MENTNDLAVTTEMAAKLLNTTVNNMHRLRQTGCIRAVKLGKNFLYSMDEIKRFLNDYAGMDLSNEANMIEARELIERKER